MALTKITANIIEDGAISTASLANTSITADKLHTTLDLTGKTITVATATAGDNDTTAASTAFVSTAIANLADSAPETLNTLNELAAALGDDANFSTTVTNSIALKAPLASPTFTGTLTASGLVYPTSDGTNGQVLTTDGAGNLSFSTISGYTDSDVETYLNTSEIYTDPTNNRLGIGTSSPDVKLHLEDASRVDIKFEKTGSETHYIRKDGDFLRFRGHDDNTVLFELKNNTNGLNVCSFPAGRLGVGTTTPDSKLHVDGNFDGPLVTIHNTGGATSAYAGLEVETSTTGSYVQRWLNAGSELMRVVGNGNVGIGTNNPSVELHVYSANQDALKVEVATAINQIELKNNSGSPTYITQDSFGLQIKADENGFGGTASFFSVKVKAAERLRIAHDGETTISGTKMNVISSSEAVMGAQSTGYSYWRVVADNSPNTYFQAGTGQSSSQVKMYFTGMYGSNNTMTVDTPNARVGIGTTAPSSTLTVNGSVSKSSGSFRIDHPLESKTNTHDLVHSFVEAPQADNIYRGKVDLVDGSAAVNIDTVAGMTEGTFAALNREIQCFTTNESNWDAVKGSVSGNILTIESQNSESTATISWLVIGERQDEHMYDTEWTDDNGKVIVEPLK